MTRMKQIPTGEPIKACFFSGYLRTILILVLLIPALVNAQSKKDSSYGGQFTLGMRNTISFFSDANSMGNGAGGEFRIRLGKHLNTEWYADYITTNIQNLGLRRDGHIGWSVLFYLNRHPLTKGKITPYVLAGHCFDYTKVYSLWPAVTPQERWSAAVQGGAGLHYNLTRNFDISLITQYMLHLGTHVETSVVTDVATQQNYLNIEKLSGGSLDGHMLITFSANYLLGRL
jgi:hypothetical protein